jgi:hypothetical protein
MADPHEMVFAKGIFTATIGARNMMVRGLKNSAFSKNVELTIDTDKGLFSSNYRITLKGKRSAVEAIIAEIKSIEAQLATSEEE